jgi:hypothetical protein
MRVGDYVRTKSGIIGKIESKNYIDYSDWLIDTLYYNDDGIIDDWTCGVKEYDIIKSNPNIIDLFEEHDLVVIEYYSVRYKERVTRLFEVDYKDKEFMTLKNAHCDFMLRNNEFNDEDKKLKPIIKSIVTHEQFKSMEYKVGEQ